MNLKFFWLCTHFENIVSKHTKFALVLILHMRSNLSEIGSVNFCGIELVKEVDGLVLHKLTR